jgi:ATP-binding cassette subfamily F protein 3
MGGYDSLRDIPQVLRRLGFAEADLAKPTSRLSGGEKTRLALAKLLLSAPDILLLDEPTNHLDLAATEWLEDFLRSFGGALILVSHDRTLLDRVVTMVAELEKSRMTFYTGNYSAYAVQRAERRARQAEQYEREQAEIRRLEEFFEKWKNTPSKRKQAQMRLRWAERIRGNATERVAGDERSMRADVKPTLRSGEETVVFDRLTKALGERVLFENLSAIIRRGQRVGIVGPNGAGKTTLIRILLGLERPTSGSARLGANVTVGYFAQEASDLDLDETVLENLLNVAEMTPGEARNYLGRFLFSGDDVFRPVSDLSGGEKNKLSLARLTYLRPNLLVLDEPTNHLDIDSREALSEMLARYTGTMLLVSHDRYLLDQVTTHTLQIDQGVARLYEGGYSATEEARRNAVRPACVGVGESAPQQQRRSSEGNPLTAGMNSFELSRARKRAAREVENLERRVAELEDWVKRIEEALSSPMPGDDVVQIAQDHTRAQIELSEALDAWEKAVSYAEGIGAAV